MSIEKSSPTEKKSERLKRAMNILELKQVDIVRETKYSKAQVSAVVNSVDEPSDCFLQIFAKE